MDFLFSHVMEIAPGFYGQQTWKLSGSTFYIHLLYIYTPNMTRLQFSAPS